MKIKAIKSKKLLNIRTVIVTGGSSGIGLETAKTLIDKGYDVLNLDIKNSTKINTVVCDLKNEVEVKSIFSKLLKTKNIVGIFLNAGIYKSGSIEETSTSDFEQIINTNIYANFFILKEIIPYFKKNKKGSIVINSSDQALVGKKNCFVYGLTKGALAQIAKSLALDYGQFNIRVNAICPGAIETPLFDKAIEQNSKRLKTSKKKLIRETVKKYPIGRIGQPRDVAHLVCFLLSDESEFITGSVLSIDGGYVAG